MAELLPNEKGCGFSGKRAKRDFDCSMFGENEEKKKKNKTNKENSWGAQMGGTQIIRPKMGCPTVG